MDYLKNELDETTITICRLTEAHYQHYISGLKKIYDLFYKNELEKEYHPLPEIVLEELFRDRDIVNAFVKKHHDKKGNHCEEVRTLIYENLAWFLDEFSGFLDPKWKCK
jgi:hypothetical protein